MLKTRAELKSEALNNLKGNWLNSIGAVILASFIPTTLYLLMEYNPSPILAILSLIIEIPFTIGLISFFLKTAKGEKPELIRIFDVFKNLLKYIALYLEIFFFTYLWALLLIIPGIIKAYSYSMASYILLDNPNTNPLDAITESKRLMDGHKWELFVLHISFIGWSLISVLTLGIGFIFLIPYIHTTTSNFYLELIKEKNLSNRNTTSDNSKENIIKNHEDKNSNPIKSN